MPHKDICNKFLTLNLIRFYQDALVRIDNSSIMFLTFPRFFLDRVEYDAPYTYEALKSILPDTMKTKNDLMSYGASTRRRLQDWWKKRRVFH